MHGNAVIGEEGHLERQQRHEVIDALGELAGAAGAPGPELGRHVMHDGNAGAAHLVGEPQAEARRIHGDDDIGLELAGGGGRLVEPFDEARQMRDHLGEPHERELVHGEQAFEAVGRALRAADAGEADAAVGLRFQRAHEPSGEVVAGGLARDDKDQRLLPAHATLHHDIRCPNARVGPVSLKFHA